MAKPTDAKPTDAKPTDARPTDAKPTVDDRGDAASVVDPATDDPARLALDEALRALPALDLPADRTSALRAQAHARLAGVPPRAVDTGAAHTAGAKRLRRRAEVMMCVAVAAAQLFWMLDAALVPYR